MISLRYGLKTEIGTKGQVGMNIVNEIEYIKEQLRHLSRVYLLYNWQTARVV